MEVQVLRRDEQPNIVEGRFTARPIILRCDFDRTGKYNVVVMRPDGVGTAFYTGWATRRKGFSRQWTMPIRDLSGVWRVICVFHGSDESVENQMLEGLLDEAVEEHRAVGRVDILDQDLVPQPSHFKLQWPERDVTLPYPTLWLQGTADPSTELIVGGQTHVLKPHTGRQFALPIPLQFDSANLVEVEGGEGTDGFRTSFSAYTVKGAVDHDTQLQGQQETTITRVGTFEPVDFALNVHCRGNQTTAKKTRVTGKVPPSSKVKMEEEEIPLDTDERFEVELPLVDGENEFTFEITTEEQTFTKTVTIVREWDKAVYEWETPTEDMATTQTTTLVRGWVEEGTIVEIDGEQVPLEEVDPTTGTQDFYHWRILHLGVNEVELKVVDPRKNQEEPLVSRETRWVECMPGKTTVGLITPDPKFQSFTNPLEVRGQATPGARVWVAGGEVTVGKDGMFTAMVTLEPGENHIEVTARKQSFYEGDYPAVRTIATPLATIQTIDQDEHLAKYLRKNNFNTIGDVLTHPANRFMADVETGKIPVHSLMELQKLLGFLLLGRNGLGLFGEKEAYLISKCPEIMSVEELVTIAPEDLVAILTPISEREKMPCPTINDVIRWQKTLDELLFELQESYLS